MGALATATRPAGQRRYRSFTLLCVVALVAISFWLGAGGWTRVILLAQPGFTVTAIDREAQTLTLSRVQETFVVSCKNRCDLFKLGKRYSMRQRGGALEFTKEGEKIEMPIVREHFDFETPTGGHG